MTPDDIRKTIVEALARIAPEVDPASIEPGAGLRDQLDLDSMDFLNLVLALHERLGVEIPERDYPRLHTLDSAVAYLASKVGASTAELAAESPDEKSEALAESRSAPPTPGKRAP